MNIITSKKAASEIWWVIMTAVIAIIVIILILIWFRGSGEKAFGGINNQLDDADQDKVTNLFDQCPNTPSGIEVDASGCSEAQRAEQSKATPK